MGGWGVAGTALAATRLATSSPSHAKAPSSLGTVSPPPAPGDTVTALSNVTGAATVLKWDMSTLAAWRAAGVRVGPAGAAKAVSGGVGAELPITSGYVESHSDHSFKPGYLLGSIDHFGSGLTFATASNSVEATNLVFDLGDSTVYGTIGATEDIPLFSLAQTRRLVVRSGRTLKIEGEQLDLTQTGAVELDSLFHTTAITANSELASARITVRGQVSQYTYDDETVEYTRLSGIDLSFTFGTQALAALGSVGITPSTTGSAVYDTSLAEVSFPITGGTAVVHPNRQGQPAHIAGVVLGWGDGLVLGGASASVTLSDLTFVPANATVYASVNGGADNGAVFSVKYAKRSGISLEGGNLELRGALLDLTAGGAEALNGVFHTTEFQSGFELGTFTLVASGG